MEHKQQEQQKNGAKKLYKPKINYKKQKKRDVKKSKEINFYI